MSQPTKLLLHPAIDEPRLQKLREVAGSMTLVNAREEQHALQEIRDADAFIGKITPKLLAASEKLRWVQSPTASLEHYLFDELVEHPCTVTNMRGLFGDVIADQVMGYVLFFARNFNHYVLHQRIQHWEPMGGEGNRVVGGLGPSTINDIDRAHQHLGDLTMGIIGLGNIGAEIARRAKAFNMTIVAVDPMREECPPEVEKILKPDQLPELLSVSDYVVIAAPHTPETVKLFRREQIQQMKSSAILINIGRGVIVDLNDLVDALRNDEIAGAGLDVFEEEPLPQGHPLWDMVDRVLITPHVAGYSPRIAERHLGVLVENVKRFVNGEKLKNVVDKRKWF